MVNVFKATIISETDENCDRLRAVLRIAFYKSFEESHFCMSVWPSGLRRQTQGAMEAQSVSRQTYLDAIVILQRWWRRILDVNVYRFYRDLISFRQKGDPAVMLRCINPVESSLIDSAAGIHVKFRLAGITFPPKIYYKIYTHRPVLDLGACAPRDYTKERSRTHRRDGREVHNKTQQVKIQDHEGWYKRIESNGWRVVSDRVIYNTSHKTDCVIEETRNKRIDFHHDRFHRRADIEKRRKQRKIEWMQKMYKLGASEQTTDCNTTRNTSTLAIQSENVYTEDIESLAAEEEELVRWTNFLDYDDYCLNWKQLATTASSDAATEERLQLCSSIHRH